MKTTELQNGENDCVKRCLASLFSVSLGDIKLGKNVTIDDLACEYNRLSKKYKPDIEWSLFIVTAPYRPKIIGYHSILVNRANRVWDPATGYHSGLNPVYLPIWQIDNGFSSWIYPSKEEYTRWIYEIANFYKIDISYEEIEGLSDIDKIRELFREKN